MKNKYKLCRIAAVTCASIVLIMLCWSWKTGNHFNDIITWIPLFLALIFQNMSSKEKEKLKDLPNNSDIEKGANASD